MGQIVTQNLPADLIALVTTTAGLPATGLTFASVSVQYRRPGDPSFNNKVLSSANFVELGFGFYRVTFDAAELNTPGAFAWLVFGAGLQNSPNEAQVREASSTLPTIAVALPVCDVTGNLSDMSGLPLVGAAVTARILGMPEILGNVALGDSNITAKTDDNGVFVLPLVRGASVEILIPRTNYRRQLVVPNLPSVDLFIGIP